MLQNYMRRVSMRSAMILWTLKKTNQRIIYSKKNLIQFGYQKSLSKIKKLIMFHAIILNYLDKNV